MKKVLLLCTSHNYNSPGESWVDKYIKADYSDKDLILSISREEAIDVICPCCNDFGVYTAAYVAEKLDLPGYDLYETTLTLHNKDKFKKFALKYDILTPKTESYDNPELAMECIQNMVFPLIIKPTDANAGNGISKVQNYEEAMVAVSEAFSKSRVKRIVVEPYIEGSQHGFCKSSITSTVLKRNPAFLQSLS